ncbi:winged helix-turn-helix transcriptional regulator [Cerasibacillus terrae]|uniref:Winged helix-turn-helix transcriptional regulator n=1 Tax=Cerasibacillus terrae TaxID=2498845 RepID=A0A5C8NL41_9BACI|nr:metalloregulator ArsR/SmtB family transcription factor [Cerasibacillus terrae]TXL61767.1 winged helix-turn-helix transcriptional regulator [Cerasibacillus terrae]
MNKRQTIDDSKHTCDSFCYDEEIVNKIKPKIEQINGVEQIFKALADPTRLKIAYALTIEKELCVCDVAHIIGATSATASHHLRLLRNMDLAKSEKKGKLVFYSLKDDHVRQLIYIAIIHANEEG